MINLNVLATFRSKEELIDYFKAMGQNITEEEIDALKQSFAKTEENGNTLTLQQLDDVAGGITLKLFLCQNKVECLLGEWPIVDRNCFHFHIVPDISPGLLTVKITKGTTVTLTEQQIKSLLKPLDDDELSIPKEAMKYFNRSNEGKKFNKEEQELYGDIIRNNLYGGFTLGTDITELEVQSNADLTITMKNGDRFTIEAHNVFLFDRVHY